MITNITGIILAGGESKRMGEDKAFLKLGSKTIIEELLSKLEKRFSKLMIIANDIEKYKKLNLPIEKDILPKKGPLGGIYTALVKSDSFYNFIFSCDTPFIDLSLINYMVDKIMGKDAIVPRWREKFEPLHAIYSKDCIPSVKKQLEDNDLKITNLFSKINLRVLEEKELESFDLQFSFANINTKEDYAGFISKAKI